MHALAKLVLFVIEPLTLVALLTAVAGGLALWRRRRSAVVVATIAGLIVVVTAFTPLADLALRQLEDRFPRTEIDPATLAGVIVLGGATDTGTIALERRTYVVNGAAERLIAAAGWRLRLPDATPVVVAGFSNRVHHRGLGEGAVARLVFAELGVALEGLTFEERSRNTFENARFTRELVAPASGRWLLITSAFHMPRAVGVFRAAGFDVAPYPVDYRVPPLNDTLWPPDVDRRFAWATIAAREWLGLASYRLLDRTGALLPAPEGNQPPASG